MNIEDLKNLQKEVIKKEKMYNKGIMIIIAVLITINLLICILLRINPMFLLFPFFFGLIFIFVIITIIKSIATSKERELFNQEFKRIFVVDTLKKVFDNLKYDTNNGLNREVIRNTGMMTLGDRYSSNDYISGTYKNVGFEQSDIHIEEEHEKKDKDGNTRKYWVTIFQGRWMIFDFNKEFIANLQITSKGFAGNLFRSNSFKKVKMEDIEFNQLFSVYTDNEHDAFYIITPSFIEKFKKIINSLNCSIMFCFINNKLHIAINNYMDAFEPNILEPINEEEITNNIIKDIKLITDFINELDLDNTIFKKED